MKMVEKLKMGANFNAGATFDMSEEVQMTKWGQSLKMIETFNTGGKFEMDDN